MRSAATSSEARVVWRFMGPIMQWVALRERPTPQWPTPIGQRSGISSPAAARYDGLSLRFSEADGGRSPARRRHERARIIATVARPGAFTSLTTSLHPLNHFASRPRWNGWMYEPASVRDPHS